MTPAILATGGFPDETYITLRVASINLNSDEVSKRLRCAADYTKRPGNWPPSPENAKRRGVWNIESTGRDPDRAIHDLLGRISPSLEDWEWLITNHDVALALSLYSSGFVKGFTLSTETIGRIFRLGIKIDFHLYSEPSE